MRIQNILVLIVLIFGLVNCESTSEPEEIIEYAPGQVIVGFVNTVSYQFSTLPFPIVKDRAVSVIASILTA